MTGGWQRVRLGDLTVADSPITYGVVKPGGPGNILFVRGGDLSNGRVLEHQLRTITRKVSEQYERTLLRGGELLICLVGQFGQVAVAPAALAGANIARQVGLIRLRKEISNEYISYYLQSPDGRANLGTFTGGSVQQVINLGDLRMVDVPIPPLPEQQRIVGMLDKAFEGIATAKANAEKNLQNAHALFQSHLQFVLLDKKWEWKVLGDVCVDVEYGSSAKSKKEGKIPVLGMGNVQDGRFDWNKLVLYGRRKWDREIPPQTQ
jgi:type I restriction enzyme S subunit